MCVKSLPYIKGVFRSLFERGKRFYLNFNGLSVAKGARIGFRICKGQINTMAGFLLVSRWFSANPVPNCSHNKSAHRTDAFILSVHAKGTPPTPTLFSFTPIHIWFLSYRKPTNAADGTVCPLCNQKKLANQLCCLCIEPNAVKVQDVGPSGRAVYGVGLRPLACSDRGVRIPPKASVPFSCECCVLSCRGLCDELITHPEESYRL